MLMKQLTERQKEVLEFVRERGSASNREIRERLGDVSRITVVRDLDVLIARGLLAETGAGRSVRYQERERGDLLRYIDAGEYFARGPDERSVRYGHFNFEIFENLSGIFSQEEIEKLEKMTMEYRGRIASLSETAKRKEFERLTIELSWKSSRIEGNTYSLIDTEVLIKERKEALGHPREEAVMILNHKRALEYGADKKSDFRMLTLGKIEALHSLLVDGLSVKTGIRKSPVGIVGTRYRPLDNEHQIREALEKTVHAINTLSDAFSKALLALALISYIQPFEDGNKRTSRLLGDAVLLAHDACPLSYRSVDEGEYKKAVVLLYEQNSLRMLKELFTEQYRFAVENYFAGKE